MDHNIPSAGTEDEKKFEKSCKANRMYENKYEQKTEFHNFDQNHRNKFPIKGFSTKRNEKVFAKNQNKNCNDFSMGTNDEIQFQDNGNNQNKCVHSCSLQDNPNLPIIQVNCNGIIFEALIDSGANVSLIQPNIISEIKQTSKVEHISRTVSIKTLDNNIIPYLTAVNLKFKIQNKYFKNTFFVTQNNWSAAYKMILGYDFIQRNKIILDASGNALIVDNDKLNFSEMPPIITHKNSVQEKSDSNNNSVQKKCEINNTVNCVRVMYNTTLLPNSFQVVQLKVPDAIAGENELMFHPQVNKKQKISIVDSIHSVNNKVINTIVENQSSEKIILRKNSKLGSVESLKEFSPANPTNDECLQINNECLQINNLNLNEIMKLRKEELLETDFDLAHLNERERKDILNLLMKNFNVFSKSYNTLGCTEAVTPEFKLLHPFPIQTKPYPIPNIARQFAQKEIQKLLDAKIIEPTLSNYCFPVIFVKKKTPEGTDPKDLKFRIVVDYRLLNCITESYKICLPKISEILHNIAGRKYYSVLDLKSAFFQIKLKESDKHKLAFCSELGNFAPTRLPFGSKNSTSYFHLLISKCLNDLKGKNLQYFLDDIILAADSIHEMKIILQKVFDRLSKFNLTLDPSKLQICKQKITYLGFSVDINGYSPSDANIVKVTSFPRPKNVKQVQSYLGMVNYFRHLIFNFAETIKPIVALTRKNTPFIWNQDCEDAFLKIQDEIINKPTLKNIDPEKELFLSTDASRTAICGILLQKFNDKFFPVQFYSKILTPAESKYPSVRRELYAIFLSVKHFHEYLYGNKFTILTDAKPLTYHLNMANQPDIIARWMLYLQQFDYTISHIPGFTNPADFLSRVSEKEVNNINLFVPPADLSLENW